MILFLVLLLSVLYVLSSWIYFLRDAKRHKVPGPTPYPIIGNGNRFLMMDSFNFMKTIYDLAEQYNDAYCFYILSERFIVLSHPRYLEELLTSTKMIDKGAPYKYMRPWLGDGLLVSTGQKWKSHRRFLNPAFNFNELNTYLPVFLKNVNLLSQTLKSHADGSPVNLFPIVALSAFHNITETILGISLKEDKETSSKYIGYIDKVSTIISSRTRDAFLGTDFLFSLTPLKSTHDKAIEFMHKHTHEVIENRRKELNNKTTESLDESADLDKKNMHLFLDMLILANDKGKGLSNQAIQDEIATFMFEGHDTTATGTSFGLYCIANNPEVQQKILEEQREILGDDLERDPTFSELQQMKYLECVIKETLRLFPSVPIMVRQTTEDTDMGGLHFPKDTSIMVNIFRMHRNPAVFEDPLEFRPERFANSNSGKSAFSYIAFSAGPRNCIGQKFAVLSLKVSLSAIVRRFVLSPGGDPEPCGDLVLKSRNGIHARLRPRNLV